MGCEQGRGGSALRPGRGVGDGRGTRGELGQGRAGVWGGPQGVQVRRGSSGPDPSPAHFRDTTNAVGPPPRGKNAHAYVRLSIRLHGATSHCALAQGATGRVGAATEPAGGWPWGAGPRSAGGETGALSSEGLPFWWERSSFPVAKGGHRAGPTQTPPVPRLQLCRRPRVLGAEGGGGFLDGVRNLRCYSDLPSRQRARYRNGYAVYT